MNNELSKVYTWLIANKISLNIGKSNFDFFFFLISVEKTTLPSQFQSFLPPQEYIRFFGVQKLFQVSGRAYLQEPLLEI